MFLAEGETTDAQPVGIFTPPSDATKSYTLDLNSNVSGLKFSSALQSISGPFSSLFWFSGLQLQYFVLLQEVLCSKNKGGKKEKAISVKRTRQKKY